MKSDMDLLEVIEVLRMHQVAIKQKDAYQPPRIKVDIAIDKAVTVLRMIERINDVL